MERTDVDPCGSCVELARLLDRIGDRVDRPELEARVRELKSLGHVPDIDGGHPIVAVIGREEWPSFVRYRLSNGWFADRAKVAAYRYGDHAYDVWEPGGSPSGGAAHRGSAPTLPLMLKVAAGSRLCGSPSCRNIAVRRRNFTGIKDAYVFVCVDHENPARCFCVGEHCGPGLPVCHGRPTAKLGRW